MKKISALILVLTMAIFCFSACTDTKQEPEPKKVSEPAPKEEAPASSGEEKTKYEEAEVYENKDGNMAAKTESGEEVELTGESFETLFAEYEKVKGTGSEKEKELLDKIQLILEAPRN